MYLKLIQFKLIMFHCLTSDTDPMRPTQTTPYIGGTCKFIGRKPLICWGRKPPISHLSKIKKTPDLPYPSIAAAYILRPASLDVSASLGTTASFSGLLRPGFTTSQLCLANCLPCLITLVSYILTIPCVLSLVLTIAIYAMPPSPLRPIKGVRGIHL